ncbi:MAG: proline--tRNA ligase [Chloroflexi bacterium RBG_16_54_18]|nr:MAG: proline--tRNA ligase [Chloroflexi bacterium RBG_16_54_18]
MSKLFSQTLREAPSEAEIPSHSLLLRAGFIRQLAAGIFTYMPMGRRSLNKIENIIRLEINQIGGQEISMPVVHPADIWKTSGRWYQVDDEMGRFKDRSGRDMVLAMTHEEVVADLVRKEVRSYRQLPLLVYHIQTKWRDDPRPRAGLIRVREFTMKDSYSLDADWEGLDLQYRAHFQAYFNIFQRCGLPVVAVKSDVGMMGGQLAHEFIFLTPIGEDTLMVCQKCGFSANRQVAKFCKPLLPQEAALEIERVSTPGCKTIDELSDFLGVPHARTAKAVFMVAETTEGQEIVEHFVFALVRGDMEVNETKLANAAKARALRPATEAEIRSTGAVPGYASPVGLKNLMVVVDDVIPHSPNLVSGANMDGFHLKNVNYGRDFQADIIADIALARDGDTCEVCGGDLSSVRGVEVGNIFKLGTRYSDAFGCNYLDAEGQPRPVVMGSYGIGSGRLLACVAEAYHDEKGLVWPVSIAPYHLHLVLLVGKGSPETSRVAERLYRELEQAGIEVLFDDRSESPGVKFNDADLIGLPIRLTVSERALQAGGVEFKRRDEEARQVIPPEEVIVKVRETLSALQDQIDAGLVEHVLSE